MNQELYFCRRIVTVLLVCLITATSSVPAQEADVPDWLGGRADTVERTERCALYAWFLDEADRKTDNEASRDELARMRVINIANKLADHHATAEAADEQTYAARLKFLVFGEPGPYHFSFRIERQRLEQLLCADCADDAPG
ncbi:hypothetical protein J2T55_001760 [Methylohalomonas lacus]|uniref:Secreted protein n=1 Tax=Methylohalomonas lacus TaxID=398773 RepID=A0AAE3L1A8_9GAMM|nr:hypothetical protein [Methylohalomonas lacus]MCS3903729.1 hypothetical protein [Methylohalomonas lacus]